MRTPEALAILQQVRFMPGWQITARNDENRFEDAVIVTVKFAVPDSDAKYFPEYKTPVWTQRESTDAPSSYSTKVVNGVLWEACNRVDFALVCTDLRTETDVLKSLHKLLAEIWDHESREFLSVGGLRPEEIKHHVEPYKPLHPHTYEGMVNMHHMNFDLTYGRI